MKQTKAKDDNSGAWIVVVGLLMVAVMPLTLIGWGLSGIWGNFEVVSAQPIGNFIGMSGPGGIGGKVVIETDQGFFPLHEAVTLAKGTPLILQVRGSGRRYVCDLPRKLCVETASEGFTIQPQGARQ
jgi:hypothetical protein